MRTESNRTFQSSSNTASTAGRTQSCGLGAWLAGRLRSAAVVVKANVGAVSEGRWNTLIIAAFLLVVGSMVCSKVIEDEAEAITKLQPLAGAAKSKWRGGMRAVQTDDVVEMEVVESVSPVSSGASLRSMEGWVVDEESSATARGVGGARQMQAM